MTLQSPDIKPGAAIAQAQIYPRCGGANISPELAWSGAPKAARSLAVTMIDQDVAPAAWSHWILVDIPPSVDRLPRGLKQPPAGARGVVSNFGAAGYAGPCPPAGSGTHHYEITVWALPVDHLDVAADANARELQTRLLKQSIAHASLSGTVQR
jgi:hypothetical protein